MVNLGNVGKTIGKAIKSIKKDQAAETAVKNETKAASRIEPGMGDDVADGKLQIQHTHDGRKKTDAPEGKPEADKPPVDNSITPTAAQLALLQGATKGSNSPSLASKLLGWGGHALAGARSLGAKAVAVTGIAVGTLTALGGIYSDEWIKSEVTKTKPKLDANGTVLKDAKGTPINEHVYPWEAGERGIVHRAVKAVPLLGGDFSPDGKSEPITRMMAAWAKANPEEYKSIIDDPKKLAGIPAGDYRDFFTEAKAEEARNLTSQASTMAARGAIQDQTRRQEQKNLRETREAVENARANDYLEDLARESGVTLKPVTQPAPAPAPTGP